jgi:hypothetical protein
MKYLLNKILEFFTVNPREKLEAEYLAQSHSLADVERRLRNIQNKNVRDWV